MKALTSWLDRWRHREPPVSPSDSAPEPAAELIEAEKMAAELVDYLLGKPLFWQIVVETPLGTRRPKMTLGGLVERIERLQAADLGPRDRERLQAVITAWEEARRRYPRQVTTKLKRELDSFVRNWKYYLEQRSRNPERWKEEYEVEVRNRHRIELVLRLLGPEGPPGLLAELEELERRAPEEEE
jgi:hypothetical protein